MFAVSGRKSAKAAASPPTWMRGTATSGWASLSGNTLDYLTGELPGNYCWPGV